MPEDNNSQVLPEGNGSDPAGGNETASDVVSISEVLGTALGKQFPTDEAALKAVKDTFDYVGKAGKGMTAVKAIMDTKGLSEDAAVDFIKNLGQPQPAPMDTSKFVPRDEYDANNFYKDNPDYAPYKELIGSLQKSTGKDLSEVVKLDAFKQIFTKAQAHDKAETSKSVIHSNERLGAAADKITSARDKASKGDSAGARTDAVAAVIEAFELGKK